MEEDDINRILNNMEARYGNAVLAKASAHKQLRNFYISKYLYGKDPQKNPNYGDRSKSTDRQKFVVGVNLWRKYHNMPIKGREPKE